MSGPSISVRIDPALFADFAKGRSAIADQKALVNDLKNSIMDVRIAGGDVAKSLQQDFQKARTSLEALEQQAKDAKEAAKGGKGDAGESGGGHGANAMLHRLHRLEHTFSSGVFAKMRAGGKIETSDLIESASSLSHAIVGRGGVIGMIAFEAARKVAEAYKHSKEETQFGTHLESEVSHGTRSQSEMNLYEQVNDDSTLLKWWALKTQHYLGHKVGQEAIEKNDKDADLMASTKDSTFDQVYKDKQKEIEDRLIESEAKKSIFHNLNPGFLLGRYIAERTDKNDFKKELEQVARAKEIHQFIGQQIKKKKSELNSVHAGIRSFSSSGSSSKRGHRRSIMVLACAFTSSMNFLHAANKASKLGWQ